MILRETPQPKRICQLLAVLAFVTLDARIAQADQATVTGNTGTLIANASLRFSIGISKYLFLRVGAADASQSDVTFTLGLNPLVAGTPGNSRPYAGAQPPGFATTITTTNPATSAGVLAVSAWTNVAGTTLTCTLAPLPAATPFAPTVTAGGIPGRADIQVVSAAGGVQHPGANLSTCNGLVSTAVPQLVTLNGSFTYNAAYVPSSLSTGTYGNIVIYTATAP